jgi:hypothetical protein
MRVDSLSQGGLPLELKDLLEKMLEEQRQLRTTIEQLRSPAGPRMLIDITFPPFKTTIDDPAYPQKQVVVGPWYDWEYSSFTNYAGD